MAMDRNQVYEFANGIKVLKKYITPNQLERYTAPDNPNLHEPVEERLLLEQLASCGRRDPLFIDIGAAVGYYAILVKQNLPDARIICVDPLTTHLQALAQHLELNACDADDFEIIHKAIWHTNGTISMKAMDYSTHIYQHENSAPDEPGIFQAESVAINDFHRYAGSAC